MTVKFRRSRSPLRIAATRYLFLLVNLRHEGESLGLPVDRRVRLHGLMAPRSFPERGPPHHEEASEERGGEFEAVVRVELQFGKEVAQRDTEKRSRGERERGGGDGVGRGGVEPADSEEEEADSRGDHQGEAEVDEVGQRFWRSASNHEADDRQRVGGFVDERREEDAPGRRPENLSPSLVR